MPFNIYLLGDLGSCFQHLPHPVLWSVVLLDKKVEFDTIKKKCLRVFNQMLELFQQLRSRIRLFINCKLKLVSTLAAKLGTDFLGKLVKLNFPKGPLHDYITEEIQWEDQDLHIWRLEPTNS